MNAEKNARVAATVAEFYEFFDSVKDQLNPDGLDYLLTRELGEELERFQDDTPLRFELSNRTETSGSGYMGYEVASLELDVHLSSEKFEVICSLSGNTALEFLELWLHRGV